MVARNRVTSSLSSNTNIKLSSLPKFYGVSGFIWSLVLITCSSFVISLSPLGSILKGYGGDYLYIASIAAISFVGSIVIINKVIRPEFNARTHVEKIIKSILFLSAFFSISITIMIIASVLFESILFFKQVSFYDFFFGLSWSPQTARVSTETGNLEGFGAVSIFIGTLMITFIAILVAVPLGLMSAIFLSEFANKKVRSFIKPILEVLAGIPTVVYGYFAVITIAPIVRDLGVDLGLDISTESALVAGSVMGIMIIPFILSLSDDAMHSVPNLLRDASYALGATKRETVTRVIIPAAFPGIMSAVLLAISRAIGETMIVVMAAGLTANLTANPFESVTTVTTQIVTLLIGDQEFDSPKTLAAFALGLTLFVITLLLNILSLYITRKYQEKYD